MGTTLDYEIDDIAKGGENLGWVKTYTLLPEGRAGQEERKTEKKRTNPVVAFFPTSTLYWKAVTKGTRKKPKERALKSEGIRKKAKRGFLEMAWFLFIFCSISLF